MDEPLNREFLDRLALACSGENVGRIAVATGVTRESVRRIRKGLAEPDERFLTRLCEHLGVSADWLLHGQGPQFRQPEPPAE